jgi:hypothetical protein
MVFLSVVVAAMLVVGLAAKDAKAAGGFAPVGPMLGARKDFGATLLDDGRVLAVGGRGVGNALITAAEIFDPATGLFTPTGSLAAGREVFDVVRLNDGRVFVPGTAATPNEIFDPGPGTFVQTGPMNTPRGNSSLALLPDGRVLIAGGEAAGGVVLASAEIYDPSTGIYSSTGPMSIPRALSRDAPLADGRVLIAGGRPEAGLTEVAEIYDPSTGTFSDSGTMAAERTGAHSMITLSSGEVLVAGGTSLTPEPKYELFDPSSGFFNGFYVRSSTSNPTLSELADGTVLSLGNSPEIVNPVTQVVRTFPGPVAWNGHDAVTLPDQRVLIFGGFHPTEGASVPSRAYLYYPNGLPKPVVAETVNLREVSGKTLFSCPRQGTFDPVPEKTQLRVGCEVDTRRGTVELSSAEGPGVKRARFWRGIFRVSQNRRTGRTFINLSGRDTCSDLSRIPATATTSRRRKPNGAWGSGSGSHTTSGNRGSAGVRGTIWYVEDRCNGTTFFKVRQGVVAVRDFARKKTIRLTAGKTYVAGGRNR